MAATVALAPDSWTAYAAGTDGGHFAEVCEALLEQSVDTWAGQPLGLEDWQAAHMAEALAHDAQGIPYWASVVLLVPRKNGKTTLLAAYGIYRLLFDGGAPEILLAASSDRQAGRLFDAAVSFIRRSPWLLERLVVREYLGEIARRDGEGKMLRLASDFRALHGYNPSLVIADELAQWTTPSLRRAWAALTTAGGARRSAQVFSITVAGESIYRHDSILGRLIDGNESHGELERPHEALTISRNHEARVLLVRYESTSQDPEDTTAHKLANPASWITEEWLSRQARNPELAASDFLQLHANVWAAGEDSWLTAQLVAELVAPARMVLPGEEIALGFDGSRYDDATGLIGCCLSDGHQFVLGAWERPEHARHWEVPSGEVDAAMSAAMDTYVVRRAYLDPPYWQSEIDGWAREWGSVIAPWATNRPAPMSSAVERWHTDAVAGAFTLSGDRRLRVHLLNAHRERTRAGYWLTKDQKGSPHKIDLAVAAVLAYEARNDALATTRRRGGRVMAF